MTNTEAMREQFEKVFPMPRNCTWTGNGYAPTSYHAWDAQHHCERWKGWQAASRSSEDKGVPEGWMPIESAPKDGTVILGWIVAPEIDYSEAFAAPSLMHWQPGFKSSVCNRSANWNKQWRGEPTHWMPLPAPPQSAPVDGGGAQHAED